MKGYGQQLEATKFYHEAKFGAQIKNSSMSCLISKTPLYRSCNIFFVSTTLRMTIKHLTIRILLPDHVGFMKEITPLNYKVHKPKHDFHNFDDDDVHKWLYKCNRYFDI